MSDFDFYDPTADQAASDEWQHISNDLWNLQIPFHQMGDEAWQASDYETMHNMYWAEELAETAGQEAYDQSWEAYYGPINAEGYTALDASMGYTSTDTSFIEPASSAGSMSMISDYSATSTL
ncbi:MAG: hypothetical protein Q8M22_01655 [Actinomycetota bacterium]|nr:hypothetical protein [Actinomycetota bacterium]